MKYFFLSAAVVTIAFANLSHAFFFNNIGTNGANSALNWGSNSGRGLGLGLGGQLSGGLGGGMGGGLSGGLSLGLSGGLGSQTNQNPGFGGLNPFGSLVSGFSNAATNILNTGANMVGNTINGATNMASGMGATSGGSSHMEWKGNGQNPVEIVTTTTLRYKTLTLNQVGITISYLPDGSPCYIVTNYVPQNTFAARPCPQLDGTMKYILSTIHTFSPSNLNLPTIQPQGPGTQYVTLCDKSTLYLFTILSSPNQPGAYPVKRGNNVIYLYSISLIVKPGQSISAQPQPGLIEAMSPEGNIIYIINIYHRTPKPNAKPVKQPDGSYIYIETVTTNDKPQGIPSAQPQKLGVEKIELPNKTVYYLITIKSSPNNPGSRPIKLDDGSTLYVITFLYTEKPKPSVEPLKEIPPATEPQLQKVTTFDGRVYYILTYRSPIQVPGGIPVKGPGNSIQYLVTIRLPNKPDTKAPEKTPLKEEKGPDGTLQYVPDTPNPSGKEPSEEYPYELYPSEQLSGQYPSGEQPSRQQQSQQNPSPGQNSFVHYPTGQQSYPQQSGQYPTGPQPNGEQPSRQQQSQQNPSPGQNSFVLYPTEQQLSPQQSGQYPTGPQPNGEQPSRQQQSQQNPSPGQNSFVQYPTGQLSYPQQSGQYPTGPQPNGEQPSRQQQSQQNPSPGQNSFVQYPNEQLSYPQQSGQYPTGPQPNGEQPSRQQQSQQNPSPGQNSFVQYPTEQPSGVQQYPYGQPSEKLPAPKGPCINEVTKEDNSKYYCVWMPTKNPQPGDVPVSLPDGTTMVLHPTITDTKPTGNLPEGDKIKEVKSPNGKPMYIVSSQQPQQQPQKEPGQPRPEQPQPEQQQQNPSGQPSGVQQYPYGQPSEKLPAPKGPCINEVTKEDNSKYYCVWMPTKNPQPGDVPVSLPDGTTMVLHPTITDTKPMGNLPEGDKIKEVKSPNGKPMYIVSSQQPQQQPQKEPGQPRPEQPQPGQQQQNPSGQPSGVQQYPYGQPSEKLPAPKGPCINEVTKEDNSKYYCVWMPTKNPQPGDVPVSLPDGTTMVLHPTITDTKPMGNLPEGDKIKEVKSPNGKPMYIVSSQQPQQQPQKEPGQPRPEQPQPGQQQQNPSGQPSGVQQYPYGQPSEKLPAPKGPCINEVTKEDNSKYYCVWMPTKNPQPGDVPVSLPDGTTMVLHPTITDTKPMGNLPEGDKIKEVKSPNGKPMYIVSSQQPQQQPQKEPGQPRPEQPQPGQQQQNPSGQPSGVQQYPYGQPSEKLPAPKGPCINEVTKEDNSKYYCVWMPTKNPQPGDVPVSLPDGTTMVLHPTITDTKPMGNLPEGDKIKEVKSPNGKPMYIVSSQQPQQQPQKEPGQPRPEQPQPGQQQQNPSGQPSGVQQYPYGQPSEKLPAPKGPCINEVTKEDNSKYYCVWMPTKNPQPGDVPVSLPDGTTMVLHPTITDTKPMGNLPEGDKIKEVKSPNGKPMYIVSSQQPQQQPQKEPGQPRPEQPQPGQQQQNPSGQPSGGQPGQQWPPQQTGQPQSVQQNPGQQIVQDLPTPTTSSIQPVIRPDGSMVYYKYIISDNFVPGSKPVTQPDGTVVYMTIYIQKEKPLEKLPVMATVQQVQGPNGKPGYIINKTTIIYQVMQEEEQPQQDSQVPEGGSSVITIQVAGNGNGALPQQVIDMILQNPDQIPQQIKDLLKGLKIDIKTVIEAAKNGQPIVISGSSGPNGNAPGQGAPNSNGGGSPNGGYPNQGGGTVMTYPSGGVYPSGGNQNQGGGTVMTYPSGGVYPSGGNQNQGGGTVMTYPSGGAYPSGGNQNQGGGTVMTYPSGGVYPSGGNQNQGGGTVMTYPSGGAYPSGGNQNQGGGTVMTYPGGGVYPSGGNQNQGGGTVMTYPSGGVYPSGGNQNQGGSTVMTYPGYSGYPSGGNQTPGTFTMMTGGSGPQNGGYSTSYPNNGGWSMQR